MPQIEHAELSPGDLRIQGWIGQMAANGCTAEEIDEVFSKRIPHFSDGKQWSPEEIAHLAGENPGLNVQSRLYAAEDLVAAACRSARNRTLA